MPSFFSMGLRARLLLLLALAMLPAFVLLLNVAVRDRQARVADEEHDIALLTRIVAAQHSERIAGLEQSLAAVAVLAEVTPLDRLDPAACQRRLADLLATSRGLTSISLAGADGLLVCSSATMVSATSAADREYFQRAMATGRFTVGTHIVGRLTGKPVLPLAMPILNAQGVPQAALVAALDLVWLGGTATYTDLPAGGVADLLDANGTILTRYPDPERWTGAARANFQTVRDIAARGDGSGQLVGVDGVKRLYGVARLDVAEDLYVTVGLPESVAFAGADRALRLALAGMGVAALIAALVAVWGSDAFVLRPVHRLGEAARRLRAGDLSARAELPTGRGELTGLGAEFDAMVTALAERDAARLRAEQEVAASEERYRLMAMNASDVLYVVDLNTDAVTWYGDVDTPLGYAPGEFPRSMAGWEESLHPEDRAAVLAAYEQSCADMSRFAVEYRIRRKDGTYLTWADRGQPLPGADGPAALFVGGCTDITERKQEEERRALLLAVTEIIAAAPALTEAIDRTLTVLCERFGWQVAEVWRLEPHDGQFHLFRARYAALPELAEFAAFSRTWSFGPGVGLPGRALAAGEPVWITDLTAPADNPRRQVAAAAALRTSIAFPVMSAAGFLGLFVLSSRDRQVPDAGWLSAMNSIGGLVGQFWERVRVEADRDRFFTLSLDLLCTVTFDGRVTRVNPASEQVFGYREEEMAGRFLLDFVHPDDLPLAQSELGRLAAGEPVEGAVIRCRHRDGSYRWLSWAAVPVVEERVIYAAAHDITPLMRADDVLRRQAAELERSNADLAQFAYVASHDLQEPLRIVSSFSQLLERRYQGQLDEKADQYIYYIVDAAQRMQTLILDLLAYSRVQTQGNPPQAVESGATLAAALVNLGQAIAESGAQVTCDPLPSVLADGSQLAQLFQNLVGNAIKFHGEKPPRVQVSAERDGGMWRFAVRDDGIGIETEFAERIFEVFQRLHTRAEYPGTGIGLALCKRIVQRHNGRIWVESRPGEGSTFYFTLPPADPPGDGEERAA